MTMAHRPLHIRCIGNTLGGTDQMQVIFGKDDLAFINYESSMTYGGDTQRTRAEIVLDRKQAQRLVERLNQWLGNSPTDDSPEEI